MSQDISFPFVIMIGAAKCGTSSLYNYLAEHPQIARCRMKEPEFWSYDPFFRRGMTWYRRLWNLETDRHRFALEGSTGYTKCASPPNPAPARMAESGAEFRFIYLIRDPIQRIESHLRFEAARGSDGETARIHGVPATLVHASRYAFQLDEFARHFSRGNIHVVLTEELRENPMAVVRGVCAFLGIDSEYQFQELDKVYGRSADAKGYVNWWMRLRQFPLVRQVARCVVPPSLQWPVRRFLLRREPEAVPSLNAEQRRLLTDELRPDVERLRAEYGVDTSRWNLGTSNTEAAG